MESLGVYSIRSCPPTHDRQCAATCNKVITMSNHTQYVFNMKLSHIHIYDSPMPCNRVPFNSTESDFIHRHADI